MNGTKIEEKGTPKLCIFSKIVWNPN